jgi:hypothetical protein
MPTPAATKTRKKVPSNSEKRAPPLLTGIVEIGYSVDDLLFVPSDRAELWDFLECGHFHPVSISALRKSSPASGDEGLEVHGVG